MKRLSERQLVKEINKNINKVMSYEATYKSIAERLSVVATPNIKLQGKDMKIDVLNIRNSKSLNKVERINTLNSILSKSIKSADMLRTHTGGEVRTSIAIDILLEARSSARYEGMVDSAIKSGSVENEEDFFIRTARKTINYGGIGDKQAFRTKLNEALRANDYNPIPDYLL